MRWIVVVVVVVLTGTSIAKVKCWQRQVVYGCVLIGQHLVCVNSAMNS